MAIRRTFERVKSAYSYHRRNPGPFASVSVSGVADFSEEER
jgi:hypothetical protein